MKNNGLTNAQLKAFSKIAKEELFVDTLETQNSDSLDFHDVAVWGIKEAMRQAYELGKKVGKESK